MIRIKWCVMGLCLLVLFNGRVVFTAAGGGMVYQGNPSNYSGLVAGLQPGDTLVLAAGTYRDGLFLTDLNGTATHPIVIRGPESGARAVFEADACICFNTVEIRDTSYVEVYNLELDGQHLSGVDGVKAGGDATVNWAHHITLENLYIHDHDGSQGTVGISTKIPTWHWTIRGNIIEDTGTGLYLGNSNGDSPFVAGLIEGNLIMDTVGYNMQVKHQHERTAVSGMPVTDATTIIRHNVFSKANNASTGGNARPNLLVGHWPLSGNGSDDMYEIYGNFFYQNPTGEPLFQGEGNVALYNNLFYDDSSDGDAIWVQPHNDDPQTIFIFNNSIVASDLGVKVSGVDAAFAQWVVGNAIFAATPMSMAPEVITADNVTDSFANATAYLVNPTGTLGSIGDPFDLYPLVDTLDGAMLNTAPFAALTAWQEDFNSVLHDGTLRGAYAGEGSNSGWLPELARKPLITEPPFQPTDFIYLPLMLRNN